MLISGVLPAWWWWRRRAARRADRWLCAACGYDLRGSVGGACPECGSPPEPAR